MLASLKTAVMGTVMITGIVLSFVGPILLLLKIPGERRLVWMGLILALLWWIFLIDLIRKLVE